MSEKFEEEKSIDHCRVSESVTKISSRKNEKKNKLTIGWYWIRSSDWQIKEEGQMRWFEKP